MIVLLIIFIIIFIIFIICNFFLEKKMEKFCYGNDFCNGNKKSTLCINQKCLDCGLQSSCNNDDDCSPSLCVDGCCQ
jgi:hypothetical protein